ncbi:MAG: hypothetical protein U0230_12380 [Polyangiales bacterium]
MESLFAPVGFFSLFATIAFLVRGPWRLRRRIALVALQPLLVVMYVVPRYDNETCRSVLHTVGAPDPLGWITFPCLDMIFAVFWIHVLVWGVVATVLVGIGWRGRAGDPRSAPSGS